MRRPAPFPLRSPDFEDRFEYPTGPLAGQGDWTLDWYESASLIVNDGLRDTGGLYGANVNAVALAAYDLDEDWNAELDIAVPEACSGPFAFAIGIGDAIDLLAVQFTATSIEDDTVFGELAVATPGESPVVLPGVLRIGDVTRFVLGHQNGSLRFGFNGVWYAGYPLAGLLNLTTDLYINQYDGSAPVPSIKAVRFWSPGVY